MVVGIIEGGEKDSSPPKFDAEHGDATIFEGQWLIPVNPIDYSSDAMDIIPSIDHPKFKDESRLKSIMTPKSSR